MIGYVERVDINDDKSARFVVVVPKLSKTQFIVLRGVFESCALISISFRPTKRAADGAKRPQKSKQLADTPRR